MLDSELDDQPPSLSYATKRSLRLDSPAQAQKWSVKLYHRYGSQVKIISVDNKTYSIAFKPGEKYPIVLRFKIEDSTNVKGALHGSYFISAKLAKRLLKQRGSTESENVESLKGEKQFSHIISAVCSHARLVS